MRSGQAGLDFLGQRLIDATGFGDFVDQFKGISLELVDGQPHAHAEFGVVFEQAVAPGRAAAVSPFGIGRCRQVAAVDRRTAGGVGDQGAVAEQLAEQFDIGGFAAAGTGAAELEQRRNKLAAFDAGRF